MSFKYNEKMENKPQKETKWDRICKRYTRSNALGYKSEAIKHLITKDFIGRKHYNLMTGDEKNNTLFDPVLVMDLRHNMFREFSGKVPSITAHYRKAAFDSCKSHNITVEDHYLKNQLNCFRESLTKQYQHIKLKERELHKYSWLIDNTSIIESLEFNKKTVQDFYETPLVGLSKVNKLLTQHKECLKDSPHNKTDTCLNNQNVVSGTIASKEEFTKNSSNMISVGFREDDFNAYKNICESTTENISNDKVNLNINAKKENDKQPIRIHRSINKFLKETCDVLNEEDQKTKCLKVISNVIDHEEYSVECDKNDKNINESCKDNVSEKQAHQWSRQCSPSSLLKSSETLDAVISEITNDALLELEIEKREKNKEDDCRANEKLSLNVGSETLASEEAHNTTSSKFESCELVSNVNQKCFTKKKNIGNRAHLNVSNIQRKYFLKWVHFTTMEKIERECLSGRADRIKKINVFLDKIRQEKKYSQKIDSKVNINTNVISKKTPFDNTRITKKYQNKIKVQQNIIDLQRIKLERQERVIMELKLSKIAEESKESRKELKKELQNIIRLGDPKNKAKAKCLQLLGNMKDEDEDERLQTHGVEIPKFLRKMRERALERTIKHEQVKERRLHLEAMKEAQKLAAEEARRLEDDNVKRLRIKQIKEKRLQEKMAKELKERERQRAIENVQKADEFSRRRLLRRVGMEGFKKLIERKQEISRTLNELRITFYLRNCFQSWVTTYYIAKVKRNQKANELYENILKRRALHTWLNYVKAERSKMYVAIDWNDFQITNSTFDKWARYTETVRMIDDTKMIQAASHHEWHLKWKVLDCWQRLPQILKLEKETEERRQRWRIKIWELLPDYVPNREELNYA